MDELSHTKRREMRRPRFAKESYKNNLRNFSVSVLDEIARLDWVISGFTMIPDSVVKQIENKYNHLAPFKKRA